MVSPMLLADLRSSIVTLLVNHACNPFLQARRTWVTGIPVTLCEESTFRRAPLISNEARLDLPWNVFAGIVSRLVLRSSYAPYSDGTRLHLHLPR